MLRILIKLFSSQLGFSLVVFFRRLYLNKTERVIVFSKRKPLKKEKKFF